MHIAAFVSVSARARFSLSFFLAGRVASAAASVAAVAAASVAKPFFPLQHSKTPAPNPKFVQNLSR